MSILYILLGIVLICIFIYFFKKTALLISLVAGLIFVGYKLGLFGMILRKVFGYG